MIGKVEELSNKIKSYFQDDKGRMYGPKKFLYLLLKVAGVFLLVVLLYNLFDLLSISRPTRSLFSMYLFVLLLNWKILLIPSKPINEVSFKGIGIKFLFPIVFITIWFVAARSDADIGAAFVQLIIGLLFLAAGIVPFIINYKLAISRGKSVPLMMLLTLIFSWIVTLILAFLPEQSPEQINK